MGRADVNGLGKTRPRAKGAGSKLSPFRDGLKISWMLIKNTRWKPEGH